MHLLFIVNTTGCYFKTNSGMQSLVAKRELNTLQTTTAQLSVLYQLNEPLGVSVKNYFLSDICTWIL